MGSVAVSCRCGPSQAQPVEISVDLPLCALQSPVSWFFSHEIPIVDIGVGSAIAEQIFREVSVFLRPSRLV